MMDVILKDDIWGTSDQSPTLGEGGGVEGHRESEGNLLGIRGKVDSNLFTLTLYGKTTNK